MNEFRCVKYNGNVEIISTTKGIVATIKESEIPEIIKELQKNASNPPTCNDGHKYCNEHHTNWG